MLLLFLFLLSALSISFLSKIVSDCFTLTFLRVIVVLVSMAAAVACSSMSSSTTSFVTSSVSTTVPLVLFPLATAWTSLLTLFTVVVVIVVELLCSSPSPSPSCLSPAFLFKLFNGAVTEFAPFFCTDNTIAVVLPPTVSKEIFLPPNLASFFLPHREWKSHDSGSSAFSAFFDTAVLQT